MVWQVAGGQGTIALEILAEIPFCDQLTLFVPVGGGGLISGAHVLLSLPDCRSSLNQGIARDEYFPVLCGISQGHIKV